MCNPLLGCVTAARNALITLGKKTPCCNVYEPVPTSWTVSMSFNMETTWLHCPRNLNAHCLFATGVDSIITLGGVTLPVCLLPLFLLYSPKDAPVGLKRCNHVTLLFVVCFSFEMKRRPAVLISSPIRKRVVL